MANITIPCYPNDKVLFPAFHEDAQEWRENTLFYQDFKIAEKFGGKREIKDTFKRAFDGWKNDAKYMAELTAVTNHLLWEHYNKGDEEIAKIYDGFYKKCYAHIYQADKDGKNISPFTDEEVRMIYKVLD